MPPPVSLGELTFQQQEDVGNIRTQIQGSCDRARRNIEILKDVLPKLQQYRLYTQKKLKSGLVLIDSEAVHFDEVEKPGTYSEALARLHPGKGLEYFRYVCKSLRDHALYRLLEVLDSPRIPIASVYQICQQTIRESSHIVIGKLEKEAAAGFMKPRLQDIRDLIDKVEKETGKEKRRVLKMKVLQALDNSKASWESILKDTKLADPDIKTAGDAAALFEESLSSDPSKNPLDTFEQRMMKPYRASLSLMCADYAAQRDELMVMIASLR